jgi:hypothetical protein
MLIIRQILRPNRQMANPLSGGRIDRIGHYRAGQGHGGFTDSRGRMSALPARMDIDLGRLIHAQQGKCIKIALVHPATGHGDTTFERRGQSEDQPTAGQSQV